MPGINPNPWQTDTSIGGWFYNRNWKFRPLSWTVQMLNQLADWTAINGEGIYGTRPWLVYGEGPVRAKGGHFGEDFAYSARDIACGLKITGSDLKAVLAPETTVLREVKLVPQGK
jgi:alpha-L-fucosidase